MGTSVAESSNSSIRTWFPSSSQGKMVDGLRCTLLRETEQEVEERRILAVENISKLRGDMFVNGVARDSVIACGGLFTLYATGKFSEQLNQSVQYTVTLRSESTSDDDGAAMYEVRRNQTQSYIRVARVKDGCRISVDCQESHTSGLHIIKYIYLNLVI